MSKVFPGVPHVESPLFHQFVDELDLDAIERQAAIDLHERGFAVIDFPDVAVHGRIDRIKANLAPRFDAAQRIQDAWQFDEDVRAIAANPLSWRC